MPNTLVAGVPATRATLLDVSLAFDTLPSGQGWSYDALNSSLSETQAFSTDGTVLHMNTLGQGFQGQGHNIYSHPASPLTAGANWELDFRARVPQFESQYSDPTFNPTGFCIYGQFDNTGFSLGLTSEVKLGLVSGSGPGTVNIPFDTSGWHDYRLVGSPSSDTYSLSIDNVQASQGALSSIALPGVPDGLYFGDSTAGENAQADISSLHVFQTAVPEPSLALLGLAGIRPLRRRKLLDWKRRTTAR
jgi:hypothetical protein